LSQENVEIVRAAYGRLNQGDVEGLIALCDDGFLMDMSERTFNPEIYRGRDDLRRFYGGVTSAWASYRWDVEGTRAEGESVVALLHCHAQGREGGPAVDWHVAWLWKFQDGRPVSLRFYRDPMRALEAVGLEE